MKPDYTGLEFGTPPFDRPYVLLNMVSSLDGKAVVDGSERGLGSKVDQRLMREIRTNADVILNGAGTLRVSGASPRLGGDSALEQIRIEAGRPRFPTATVISRSGNLPLDATFFTATDFDAIVYLSEAAPRDVRNRVVAAGRPVVGVPAGHELKVALAHMKLELGAGVLLCEGGPDINGQLFALDAVDEFFLTLGPVVVSGRHGKTTVEGDVAFAREALPRFSIVSCVPNEETGEVYLRYRREREAPAGSASATGSG